ncbi:MAG: Hint domain-containing protein [Planctomycetes bacterium]|nr:Hint domain-containing protein [Planctomycetota bacterium]
MTDANQAVLDSFAYDEYGNLLGSHGSLPPFLYIGQLGYYYDEAALDYYVRARVYDPALTVFLSQDPLGFAAGPNAFSYARNNPATCSDPSGQIFAFCGFGPFGAGALGGIFGFPFIGVGPYGAGILGLPGFGIPFAGIGPFGFGMLGLPGFGIPFGGIGLFPALWLPWLQPIGFHVPPGGVGFLKPGPAAGGVGACFAAGALIRTVEGTRRIDCIAVGDRVLAYDLVTQRIVTSVVLRVDVHDEDFELVRVRCGEGPPISVTPQHPLFDGGNWANFDEFAGQQVWSSLLHKKVSLIECDRFTQRGGKVYNILTRHGTYLVGEAGLIVSGVSEADQSEVIARGLTYPLRQPVGLVAV